MFEVPGSEIKGVHITEECVMGASPIYIHRSTSASSSSNPPEQTGTTSEEEENRKYRVKQ